MEMLANSTQVNANNAFSMGVFQENLHFQKDMTEKLYSSLEQNSAVRTNDMQSNGKALNLNLTV